MADAPTHRDLFLVGRRQALLGQTRFNKAIIDVEGSDVNIVLNVSAAMGEEVVRYLVSRLNAKGLGTSKEEDLDREVYDRYQLPRLEARAAVVTLSLSRSQNNGFTVPKGSVFGTEDGITFAIQNDVAFSAGNHGPLDVLAVAQQAGPGGNVPEGTITQVLSPQGDPTLVVTHTERAAGGRDRETEEAFQARARNYFLSARRGVKEAIEEGALTTGRVTQATAVELIDGGTGLPGYRGALTISDQNGQSNTALADEVRRSLEEYRALGVPVMISSAVPQYESIVATGLQFQAGSNTTNVIESAANAILALVNGTPPGQPLRKAELLSALSRTPQLIVPDGALIQPAGDLIPSTGTVIRTTRDRIVLKG